MILLGIDPGTATTGYGLINVSTDPEAIYPVDYGQIKTSKEHLMPDRLLKIYTSVSYLIEKYSPEALVIEKLFFNTNVKTALTVGQARGISILAAGKYKLPVFEYTALQAKMELTGYGRAEKEEVSARVAELLDIKTKIRPIDASDALAIAICHTQKAVFARPSEKHSAKGAK
jgi:crossover junction endodeoxyribonuclease RuvC